jgi:hypothetical protein
LHGLSASYKRLSLPLVLVQKKANRSQIPYFVDGSLDLVAIYSSYATLSFDLPSLYLLAIGTQSEPLFIR